MDPLARSQPDPAGLYVSASSADGTATSGQRLAARPSASPPASRPCRLCGCPLRLVTGINGELVPLDARTRVYVVCGDGEKSIALDLGQLIEQGLELWRTVGSGAEQINGVQGVYVSHYATCSKAKGREDTTGARS